MASFSPRCDIGAPPAHRSGVFAMSVCMFALIASEFLPISLLMPMAADLHITEGMAGQGITIFGAFAVLTSLSISWRANTHEPQDAAAGADGTV